MHPLRQDPVQGAEARSATQQLPTRPAGFDSSGNVCQHLGRVYGQRTAPQGGVQLQERSGAGCHSEGCVTCRTFIAYTVLTGRCSEELLVPSPRHRGLGPCPVSACTPPAAAAPTPP